MNLTNLKPGEPKELVDRVSADLRAARSVEQACQGLTAEMYERCASGAPPTRSLVLSRIYLSLPASALDAGGREFAHKMTGADPGPKDIFLALVGTKGDQPDWCDKARSKGHRAIPLNRQTVTTVPMLARCFQQIGFDLDIVLAGETGIKVEGVARSFGLFHVEEARGSPYVPAQKEFVVPHGVRSALGCGTMLPNGAVSIFIGFSRHAIPPNAAVPLVSLMPAFWQVVQPVYRRGAIFAA